MSIYKRKNVIFSETLSQGNKGEWLIIRHFIKAGHFVKKVDHKKKPYDLEIITGGKTKRIEVKTHLGCSDKKKMVYNTFFAEVIQNTDIGSVPEYLKTDDIDIVIHISLYTNQGYVFKHSVYKDYVIKNKSSAREARYATSSGITIPWESKEAGFLGKIDLSQ